MKLPRFEGLMDSRVARGDACNQDQLPSCSDRQNARKWIAETWISIQSTLELIIIIQIRTLAESNLKGT